MKKPEPDTIPDGSPGLVVGSTPLAILRYPREEDREPFLRARRNSRETLARWEPLPPPGSAIDHPSIFDRALARITDQRSRSLLVCDATSGEITGAINISEIVLGPLRSAFLGYWTADAHARRAYATAGVSLAVDYALGPLTLHRLEANIQPNNEASIRVVRKCGFRREGFSPRYLRIAGQWADHERWAVTSEDIKQTSHAHA